jgi:hypothetical protein
MDFSTPDRESADPSLEMTSILCIVTLFGSQAILTLGVGVFQQRYLRQATTNTLDVISTKSPNGLVGTHGEISFT